MLSRQFLAAVALYVALSALLLWHGASLRQDILGMSSDPLLFIWCIAWWPHALAQHIDPLHLHLVWQPEGLDLAWATCVPLLAILAAPLTLLAGPVVSYNLLTLAAPVLAAGGAYLLCLYVTRSPLAAFCGGLIFGFSSYEMAESLEHLNLDFTVFVPLLLLIVLARLDGRLTRLAAALLFALALAGQFYISTEVALTVLLSGGLVWLLALAFLPVRRPELRRLVADGALAGLFALPLLAPFLWDIVTTPRGVFIPPGWSWVTSAHLGNLLAATPGATLYLPQWHNAGGLFGLLPETDLCAGLPLLLILVLVWRVRARPTARLLLAAYAALVLASLGPLLWLGTRPTHVPLPWVVVMQLPLIGSALPGRFLLYADLALALIAACWVAWGGHPWRRAAFAVFALMATLAPPHIVTPAPYSDFFRPGHVQAVLGPAARVIILPGADVDRSGFWQAQSGFAFSQGTGYLGMPPRAALRFPAVHAIAFGLAMPGFAPALADFARASGASYVLAGPGVRDDLLTQLLAANWPHRADEDVTIFTVPDMPR
jgi:hypothetical protein